MKYAAIDCGTNTTRLLIVDESGNKICHELRTTRLGEGVDKTGHLSEGAIERTLVALREYKSLLEINQVQSLRAVATSAARDAKNSNEFLHGAQEILGIEPELLDGDQEGRLAYAGAVGSNSVGPTLVLDIGGGSTEFILGGVDRKPIAFSIDIGCVRLTERCLSSHPVEPPQLRSAYDLLTDLLNSLENGSLIQSSRPNLIGVAGTITTLAGIDLGLIAYEPHRIQGHILKLESIEKILALLTSSSLDDLKRMPSMPSGREDVIVAGTVILKAVLDFFSFRHLTVSDNDILDGLVGAQRGEFDGLA